MVDLIKSNNQVVLLPITPERLAYAEAHAHRGSMNKRSMMEGARNVEGLLGELAVRDHFPMLAYEPNDNYDFIFRHKNTALTIDVKNKYDVKRFGDRPKLDWDCTIFKYEAKKVCKLYLFTSTNSTNTKIWLKGYIAKERIVTPERLIPAGTWRTAGQGSVPFREDNYVAQVRELYPIDFLKKFLESASTK